MRRTPTREGAGAGATAPRRQRARGPGKPKVQLQFLDNGDYLLLDPDVASHLWPSSPPGITVVRVDTVTIDGKEVYLALRLALYHATHRLAETKAIVVEK